jgi:hypothetical protein
MHLFDIRRWFFHFLPAECLIFPAFLGTGFVFRAFFIVGLSILSASLLHLHQSDLISLCRKLLLG